MSLTAVPPGNVAANKIIALAVLGAPLAKVDAFANGDDFRRHDLHAVGTQALRRADHDVIRTGSRINRRGRTWKGAWIDHASGGPSDAAGGTGGEEKGELAIS